MFLNFLFVALGGAVGSVGRYGIGLALRGWHQGFPLATFVVNVIGSLVIGLLAGWVANDAHPETQRQLWLLLAVGLCGGFTTFSSFSFETVTLLRNGNALVALGYVALSILLCLGATALGYALTHR